MLRLAVCLAMGAARLGELAYSKRNVAGNGPARQGRLSEQSYPAMVALHTAVIAGTAIRGRGRASWGWLALLLALQPLRVWILLTLGRRWNTRGAVAAGMTVERGGPYRYLRHPNYVLVFLELIALPLAFGLRGLALAGAVVNAALLAIRVRDEEALLSELPGYDEYARETRRFVPRLF